MALHAWSSSLKCLFRAFQPLPDTNGKGGPSFWPVESPEGKQVSGHWFFVTQLFLACARVLVLIF